jgi:GTP-binding protein
MIVSDIAGTTVDSVDSAFRWKDHDFVIVDTAGLRKSSKREDHIEIIAAFKSQEAIRRAEVIAMVIDAREGPSEQDAKILDSIIEDHKGVLIIANKMDLAEKEIPEARKKFREQCERIFHFYVDVPIVFASAVTGKGVEEVLEKVVWLDGKLKTRIPTPELNDFFFDVIRKAPAPVHGTRNVKFYYLTQTKQKPPSFIAFANFPDGVDNSYRRFLSKNLKTHFGLEGIPVRIFVMRSRGA